MRALVKSCSECQPGLKYIHVPTDMKQIKCSKGKEGEEAQVTRMLDPAMQRI